MSLDVYAYDDHDANIGALSRAAKSLQGDIDFRPLEVNRPSAWDTAFSQIKELGGDFAVLLDLGFRDINTPLWSNVKAAFHEKLVHDGSCCRFNESDAIEFLVNKDELEWDVIPNSALDGLGLIFGAVENRNPGKTLIYIASGRAELGALVAFLDMLSLNHFSSNGARKIVMVRDRDGANVRNDVTAKRILNRLLEEWKAKFPSFHGDAWVNKAIDKWIGYYRRLEASGRGKGFCGHDHIRGNSADYSDLAMKIFGGDISNYENDINGVKALFQMCQENSDNEEGQSACMSGWFEPWDAAQPDRPVKSISSDCSAVVFKNVFNMAVSIKCAEHKFPLRPALPFLISLRLLANALREQDVGILDTGKAIVLHGDKGGYRLSIPLVRNSEQFFGLAKRWVEKIETGGNDIKHNGVCAALWRTLLARVDDVITASASGQEEQKLLTLFNGPGRPVCGVTFAPHYIHLHWS